MAEINIIDRNSTLFDKEDVDGFNCGNPTINETIKDLLNLQVDDSLKQRTYLAVIDDKICGFITYSISKVSHMDVEEEESIKEGHGYPVLKINYFGVDTNYQGYGIASKLMGTIMRIAVTLHYYVPIAGIYLESLSEPYTFYENKFGFQGIEASPHEEVRKSYPMGISIDVLLDEYEIPPYNQLEDLFDVKETVFNI